MCGKLKMVDRTYTEIHPLQRRTGCVSCWVDSDIRAGRTIADGHVPLSARDHPAAYAAGSPFLSLSRVASVLMFTSATLMAAEPATKPLPPEQAAKEMKLPEGFQATVF